MDGDLEAGYVPTLDELLLPEFGDAPGGLDDWDLEQLRAQDGAEAVNGWVADATERGLVAELRHRDEIRFVITPAGRRLLDEMFPRMIEVGLPASPRHRRAPARWLTQRLRSPFSK